MNGMFNLILGCNQRTSVGEDVWQNNYYFNLFLYITNVST